jgi:hypothetical protein
MTAFRPLAQASQDDLHVTGIGSNRNAPDRDPGVRRVPDSDHRREYHPRRRVTIIDQ